MHENICMRTLIYSNDWIHLTGGYIGTYVYPKPTGFVTNIAAGYPKIERLLLSQENVLSW